MIMLVIHHHPLEIVVITITLSQNYQRQPSSGIRLDNFVITIFISIIMLIIVIIVTIMIGVSAQWWIQNLPEILLRGAI